jgi:large subunit ribosomal protein L6
MSRIGKKPVAIPKGIEIENKDGVVLVKKGSVVLEVPTYNKVGIEITSENVILTLLGTDKKAGAFWGTYRALIANAIEGLVNGYEKSLEINGVGYRAAVKGKILELQLGYSHPINFEIADGLTITVEKNIVKISGVNKQLVGQAAANIRAYRKPEPYKGKGIKYTDEFIVRKAGKSSAK